MENLNSMERETKKRDYFKEHGIEVIPYQTEIPMDKEEILKAYKELYRQTVCLTKAVYSAEISANVGCITFTGTIFLGSATALAAATGGLIALANTKPMIVNNFEQSVGSGILSVAGVAGGSLVLLGIGTLASYGLYKGTVLTKAAIEQFIFSRKYLQEKNEETRRLFNIDIEKVIVKK